MGLFEQFPYTNFHELNLDWVLQQVKMVPDGLKDINDAINSIPALAREYSVEFAQPLAWDVLSDYKRNTVVFNDPEYYVSIQDVPPGTRINNAEYWQPVANLETLIDQYFQMGFYYRSTVADIAGIDYGSAVYTSGYYTAFDGGEALYTFTENPVNNLSIAHDNGYLTPIVTDTINVKALGAKGDGSTDDTQAIVKANSIGLNLYFPAGSYVIKDSIVLNSNSSLIGNGAVLLVNVTRSKVEGGKLYTVCKNLIRAEGATNIRVEGITIKGIYNNSYGYIGDVFYDQDTTSQCILFINNCSNVTLRNVRCANLSSVWNYGQTYYPNPAYPTRIDMTANTLKIANTKGLVLDNITFDDCSIEEIMLYKCDHAAITNIRYLDNALMTSVIGLWDCNGCYINNCEFKGWTFGNAINVYGSNNRIDNCTFDAYNVMGNSKQMSVDVSLECNRVLYPNGPTSADNNIISGCTFKNACVVTYRDDSLNINTVNKNLQIINCTFIHDTDMDFVLSTNGRNSSIIIMSVCDLIVKGCVFTDSYQTSTIHYTIVGLQNTMSKNILLQDCEIVGAPTGRFTFWQSAGGVFAMDNCIVDIVGPGTTAGVDTLRFTDCELTYSAGSFVCAGAQTVVAHERCTIVDNAALFAGNSTIAVLEFDDCDLTAVPTLETYSKLIIRNSTLRKSITNYNAGDLTLIGNVATYSAANNFNSSSGAIMGNMFSGVTVSILNTPVVTGNVFANAVDETAGRKFNIVAP